MAGVWSDAKVLLSIEVWERAAQAAMILPITAPFIQKFGAYAMEIVCWRLL